MPLSRLCRSIRAHLFPTALQALMLACSAKLVSNDRDRNDEATLSTSSQGTTIEAVSTVAPSTGDTEATSGASVASASPSTMLVAPDPGFLETCTSVTWTDPSQQKREAACAQHLDESSSKPSPRYVCSCDVNECPLYIYESEAPDTPPSSRLNECVVDGVASGCDDSLQAACGTPRGQHGFCEQEYYGLTPTRANQTPPVSATVVCFEQPDETHACRCSNEAELLTTTETDCNRALLTACQAPCESEAGECSPSEAGYECVCKAGFTRSVTTGLCDYALFHACEPACSNEMGACYWDPAGGPAITCRCNDDDEPRVLERDPNVAGDECRTPLVDTCGGSSDGPNAWP